MATRTETIYLNEDDLKSAIHAWLIAKYGTPTFDVVIHYQPQFDDRGIFMANATREIK